ncbi:hypothetical protein C8Q74DRAFT_997111 [Fomes fomentarius]|nr:hypothetical protein C8Q74DRAFT_997111 [Fomes fomentarius]
MRLMGFMALSLTRKLGFPSRLDSEYVPDMTRLDCDQTVHQCLESLLTARQGGAELAGTKYGVRTEVFLSSLALKSENEVVAILTRSPTNVALLREVALQPSQTHAVTCIASLGPSSL